MNRPLVGLLKSLLQVGLLGILTLAFPAYSAQFELVVNNGTGSGTYDAGATVYIAANPYEAPDPAQATSEPSDPYLPDRIFDRWTGDVGALEDVFAARTNLILPSADASVTATYKDLPRWLPTRVISHFPPDHRGVIFWFHGGGGSAIFSPYGTIATRNIVNEAYSRGLAIVVIDSFDRSSKRWDLTPDASRNRDMQRVAEVRHSLIDQGTMRADDPVYVLGISNGGTFASLWTQENQDALDFPLAAAALFISPGASEVLETRTVPTIFALAINDSELEGKLNLAAQEAFDSLFSRGIPAQLWMNYPTPVTPERFWGITGLTLDDSKAIHLALAQNGFLDAENFLVDNPTTSGWEAAIPLAYADDTYMTELSWELGCAYAEHAVMLKFTDKVLDFLESPTTYIDQPPMVTGFNPNSGYAGAPVEITGEHFYGVTDVRFNGVSVADFTVVGGSYIGVQVPNGATTGTIEVFNVVGTGVSNMSFEVLPPAITSIEPLIGPVGTPVQINGEGFTDIEAVTFNGVAATINHKYFTLLWVTVPEGATSGPIEVRNIAGATLYSEEFVVTGPQISSFEPMQGKIGSAVKITGSGFSNLTAVRFGGVEVSKYYYQSNNLIWAQVPWRALTGPIEIETGSGLSVTEEPFTVVPWSN